MRADGRHQTAFLAAVRARAIARLSFNGLIAETSIATTIGCGPVVAVSRIARALASRCSTT